MGEVVTRIDEVLVIEVEEGMLVVTSMSSTIMNLLGKRGSLVQNLPRLKLVKSLFKKSMRHLLS
ncbi:hypothetical protein C436_05395 [Haloarcula marismortui ATCC 33800]|uniref:Uncharacterized protein n=1 Tax=Haloarcula marismortui ATCC 33800 TaxID=662476 RepID=M0K4W9_9EURY|nr:hypothetical protein C436_05395 [Haloarcula sinaiiensis ATCC 33800]